MEERNLNSIADGPQIVTRTKKCKLLGLFISIHDASLCIVAFFFFFIPYPYRILWPDQSS